MGFGSLQNYKRGMPRYNILSAMSSPEQPKIHIILAGDIHQRIRTFGYNIKRCNVTDAYIIQVGDFGVGFNKPGFYATELGLLNETLVARNNHLYVIRGNHDDPSYFRESNNPFGLSNITFLADYSELNLLGLSFLFVGGATSIDKAGLEEGYDWWPDEVFVLNTEYPSVCGRVYDAVVTHTRPLQSGLFLNPRNHVGMIAATPGLAEELEAESKRVSALYDLLPIAPRAWYFGHFHESNVSSGPAPAYTRFRCCAVDELVECTLKSKPKP